MDEFPVRSVGEEDGQILVPKSSAYCTSDFQGNMGTIRGGFPVRSIVVKLCNRTQRYDIYLNRNQIFSLDCFRTSTCRTKDNFGLNMQ